MSESGSAREAKDFTDIKGSREESELSSSGSEST